MRQEGKSRHKSLIPSVFPRSFALGICLFTLYACADSRFIGKWETDNNAIAIEFFNDGTAAYLHFRHNGAEQPTKPTRRKFRMNVGNNIIVTGELVSGASG